MPTTAVDGIELSIRSMVRDGSLTMADVIWHTYDPGEHQCLITWEVFGGGIMGNLLTDTHEAELSLWPDSRYHIRVTCKNKVSHMSCVNANCWHFSSFLSFSALCLVVHSVQFHGCRLKRVITFSGGFLPTLEVLPCVCVVEIGARFM